MVLLALAACQKGPQPSTPAINAELLEGRWILMCLEQQYKIDGDDDRGPNDVIYNRGPEDTSEWDWRIDKNEGEYIVSDNSKKPSIYNVSTQEDRILFQEDKLFYMQNQYQIVSMTEESMEWNGYRFDNNYRYPSSSGDFSIHYLEVHTKLVFQKAL